MPELREKDPVDAFRSVAAVLLQPLTSGTAAVVSLTPFERVMQQLVMLPDGIFFDPLSAAAQQWPEPVDERPSDDRSAVADSPRMQRFHRECVAAAQRRKLRTGNRQDQKIRALSGSAFDKGSSSDREKCRPDDQVDSKGFAAAMDAAIDSERPDVAAAAGDAEHWLINTINAIGALVEDIESGRQRDQYLATRNTGSGTGDSVAAMDGRSHRQEAGIASAASVSHGLRPDVLARPASQRAQSVGFPSADRRRQSPLRHSLQQIEKLLLAIKPLSARADSKGNEPAADADASTAAGRAGPMKNTDNMTTHVNIDDRGLPPLATPPDQSTDRLAGRRIGPEQQPDAEHLSRLVNHALRQQAWLNGVDLS